MRRAPLRDDGIDVIAHKDELGIEPPIVKIHQVKTTTPIFQRKP